MSDTSLIDANSSQTPACLTLNDALPMVQPSLERKSWHFTPEKAREMQRKGIEARRKLKEDAEKAVQVMDELKEKAVLLPILQPDEAYRLNRLKATRDALDGLYSDLNGADDPKDQKAICDSIARLSEVERQLAGRPAPGSLRPAQAKTKRTMPESYGPVE